MAITDSLDAATQQILALLAQLKLSNCRVVQAQDTGTADSVVVAPVPAVTSYGPDLIVIADVAFPNATTTPKLNVSGLGQVTIAQSNGTAVSAGAVSGKCIFAFSSATGGGYQARLIGVSGSSGVSASALTYTGDDTSTSANTITATMSPAMPAYIKGATCRIKLLNTVTGATTANLGPGTKTVIRSDGTAIEANDLLAGQEVSLIYDGTNLQADVLSPANFVPKPTASSSIALFTLASPQGLTSNVAATVNVGNSTSSFCSIASGVVTVSKAGIYAFFGSGLIQTSQPSGELQYMSMAITKNGTALEGQSSPSFYSYGSVGAGLTEVAGDFLNIGDTIQMVVFTHSSSNDDTSDSIQSASLKIVKYT